MKAKEFTKAYQSTHEGATFGNLTEIARFVSKDRAIIRPMLKDLEKFGNDYFIPDVAEVIEGKMK